MGRLQAGDRTGLERLYDRYAKLLYSVALRIVGERTEAEDVLQQVWIQVWRTAERYDAARGSVSSWLLTLARTRALDRIRALTTRRKAHAAMPILEERPSGPPEKLEESQRHERVRKALAHLEARQRQVLELAFFGGLSQSEIAAQLTTPLGTIKSWTRRGLLTLRETLQEEATR